MTDFSKDKYMKLISPITYFVAMSNQGIRRIILYRTLFKPTFALKTKVIDSNYGRANTDFSEISVRNARDIKHIAALFTLCPRIYKWNVDMEELGKSIQRIECRGITRLKYQRHYALSTFMRRNWK